MFYGGRFSLWVSENIFLFVSIVRMVRVLFDHNHTKCDTVLDVRACLLNTSIACNVFSEVQIICTFYKKKENDIELLFELSASRFFLKL